MQPLQKQRPIFLNLFLIRFPVTAVLSILHRLSGVILVVAFPVLSYLFSRSLETTQNYIEVKALLTQGTGRWLILLLLWSICHHFYAGLRYLMIDFEWVISRQAAARSAYVVFILSFISAGFLFVEILQ